jgi:hypothetical protein
MVGCASPSDVKDCSEGKCDDSEVPDSPCDGILKDMSGAGNQKVAGRNNDFFAKLVLRQGDSCPTTFLRLRNAGRDHRDDQVDL